MVKGHLTVCWVYLVSFLFYKSIQYSSLLLDIVLLFFSNVCLFLFILLLLYIIVEVEVSTGEQVEDYIKCELIGEGSHR